MKKVVVLAGEGEYESDVTMRPVSERIAGLGDVQIEYRTPDILEDQPTFPESTFGGLDVLEDADLLVMYTRFRILPDDEIEAIAGYLAQGGNVMALRTSNHAFKPVEGSRWFDWTSGFAHNILGSAWTLHHGHLSTTDVTRVADHEVLVSVPDAFHVDSWLYDAHPPQDATVLLWGEPINPQGPTMPSPVAWTREIGDQRIFYTSLGGQSDLLRDDVLTLLTNAAAWCLRETPKTPVP